MSRSIPHSHRQFRASTGRCRRNRPINRRRLVSEALESRHLLAAVVGTDVPRTMSPPIARLDAPQLIASVASTGPLAQVRAPQANNLGLEGFATAPPADPADSAGQLLLLDAAGAPLAIAFDANTIVIGAATWCSACAQFKTQLAAAQSAGQLAGLRIVFAFGDEGGAGTAGTLQSEFLRDLPGEVAFLAPSSVAPQRYPSAFNPRTGQFDTHAADAVGDWLEGQRVVTKDAETPASPSDITASTPSCGCGSKSGSQNTSPATTSAATTSSAATPSLAAKQSLALALDSGGQAPQSLSTSPGGSTLELVDNGDTVDLVWTGTAGDDHVQFSQLDHTTIRVSLLLDNGLASSYSETFSGVTGKVKGSGLAGNDILDGAQLTSISAHLDGGTGNNILYGGAANDILIGGGNVGPKVNGPEGQQGSNILIGGAGNDILYGNAINGAEGKGGNNILSGGLGNDTLYGNWTDGGEGGGRNILVGGAGSDTLYAYKAADGAEGRGSILLAGPTTLDETALGFILAEWSSSRSDVDRIANLSGTGSGARNNGNHFLQAGATAFGDPAADQLFSDTAGGFNWLLYSSSADEAHRIKAGDAQTDLSQFHATAPGAFAITGPPNFQVNMPILLTWQASLGAESYQVVISHNPDLTEPFRVMTVPSTELSATHYETGLGGTFYLGVFASNIAGVTAATNAPYQTVIPPFDWWDLRQMLFVTDLEYAIEDVELIPPPTLYFGSAAAADYHCTRHAFEAGLLVGPWDEQLIYFKSLLAKELINIQDRVSIGGAPIVNTHDELIAAGKEQLFSGIHDAPILTQTGQLIVGARVWTGALATGEWSGFTANNWSDPLFNTAAIGRVNTGLTWLYHGTMSSTLVARLYCMQVVWEVIEL